MYTLVLICFPHLQTKYMHKKFTQASEVNLNIFLARKFAEQKSILYSKMDKQNSNSTVWPDPLKLMEYYRQVLESVHLI